MWVSSSCRSNFILQTAWTAAETNAVYEAAVWTLTVPLAVFLPALWDSVCSAMKFLLECFLLLLGKLTRIWHVRGYWAERKRKSVRPAEASCRSCSRHRWKLLFALSILSEARKPPVDGQRLDKDGPLKSCDSTNTKCSSYLELAYHSFCRELEVLIPETFCFFFFRDIFFLFYFFPFFN